MNKVYPENIIISLKNVENVEKIFQIGKNEKLTLTWAFHSSEVFNSASRKKQ